MPLITIHKDFTRKSQVERYNPVGEVNLLDWLVDHYEQPPECGMVVVMHGNVIANSDEHDNFDERVNVPAGPLDNVQIIHRPHGVETAILVGVALLSAAATILLAPKPVIPNQAGQESSSPNNRYQAARNEFRPRQAIADIAGEIRSYPDFIQRPYYEWDGANRIVTEVLRVGVGDLSLSQIRTGDTAVPGSQYTIYKEGEWPSTLLDVRNVEEVRDLVVPVRQDPSRYRAVSSGTINESSNDVIDVNDNAIPGELSLQTSDSIRITGEYFDLNFSETRPIDVVRTITNISGSQITVSPSLVEQSTTGSWNGSIERQDVPTTTEWIVLPHSDAEELWFNVEFPDGVTAGDGDLTLTLVFRYQEVDSEGNPIGAIESELESYTMNSPIPQGVTKKISVPPGKYRINMTNSSSYSTAQGARQKVVLGEAESAKSYSTAGFGDITGFIIKRRVTPSQRAGSGDRINCIAMRNLPIFNPDTGLFGSVSPTRSVAQYIMYVLHTLGGIPLSQIDYEALFDEVPDSELGYFDFSFDDADVSLRERVITAANAARMRVFYVGATWNFVREQPRPNRVALFSRRNLAPNSSNQTYRFQRDGDADGVTIKWVDPDTNVERYEYRRWNGSAVVSEQALRPIEENLAGCRNQLQAANRADWEMNKLINQRRRVTDTVIKDALYVGLGERVGWVDINDADLFDGEIVGISGSDYDTSERFTPEDGVDYYVYITDNEGNTSATVQAYPREDTEFGFSAPGLSGAYVATGVQQLGSRYFIASQDELGASDFIVVSKGRPDEQGLIQVELAEVISE